MNAPTDTRGEPFYASGEYFNGIGGGTLRSWVEDLYLKLLGRGADADGRDFWVARVQRSGRSAVSAPFFQSLESRRARVSHLYQELLGRGAQPRGLHFWADRIGDQGDIVLAINLASSAEYASRATRRF